MNSIKISVVVPSYNCSKSLLELYERLTSSLGLITDDHEIIIVNDFSPSNDWEIIKEINSRDKRVKGINLSRNFGQHYAITAGLSHTEGDWVVVMDGDLQDQPEEIISLFQKAITGYDIVFAQRENRKDKYLKKILSKYFYKLLGYLTETKQDHQVANFGIYNKKSIQAVLSMGDNIKYFPVMIRWVGFTSTSIKVKHSQRKEGISSYSLSQLMSLAINIILSFSNKPLQIAVKAGLLMSTLSFMTSIYIFSSAIFSNSAVPGWASTMVSLWFIGGLIIMVVGIVGIYVGQTFDQTKQRPKYLIKEIL